jgi:hypothetical protein
MSKDGGRDTNKDKLISLIIRKDTYKDTKPYLLDLLGLKEYSHPHAARQSGLRDRPSRIFSRPTTTPKPSCTPCG